VELPLSTVSPVDEDEADVSLVSPDEDEDELPACDVVPPLDVLDGSLPLLVPGAPVSHPAVPHELEPCGIGSTHCPASPGGALSA
jgi:hypothetical protein